MSDYPRTRISPSTAAARPTLRAADSDRQQVVHALQQHFVDGRLTQDEFDERVGRALDAKTYADLDALFLDLPRGNPPSPTTPPAPDPVYPSTHRADWTTQYAERGFRAHASAYLVVMGLLVAIWLFTTPGGYFWPIWPMLGWGIGVFSHARGKGQGKASGCGAHRPTSLSR